MNNVKSAFASKTMWLNFIMATLTILTMVNPELLTIFGLSAASQAKALELIGVITAVLNLILRMISGQPISFTPNKTAMIIGLMMLSTYGFSQVKDSAAIHDQIVMTVNGVLNSLPQTEGVGFAKMFSIIFGSLLTGMGIHWIGVRNGRKSK